MNDRNIEAIYPLAPSQHGMLLYLVLTEKSDAYFEQFFCDIEGPLDPALFRQAWELLVARHPALRTFFIWERRERPLQVVAQRMEVPFEIDDWRARSAAQQERDLADFAREDKSRLFELDRPPLLRFYLFRLGETRWRLLWSYSHLLIDGWSLGALFSEAFATYQLLARGESPTVRAGIPFKRFVDWVERQKNAGAEAFFRRHLGSLALPTELPYDRDPAARVGSRVAHSSTTGRFEHPVGALGQRIEELARSCRVTANVVYHAAFGLLLHHESNAPAVVYGSVVSGRPAKLPGVEEIIGVFVNGTPVRYDWQPGQTLRELLEALKLHLLEQRDFEYCRGSDIVRWLDMPFDRPLFEQVIVYENYPKPRPLPGFEVTIRELPEITSHALMLYVEPEENEVTLRLVYDRQRLDDGDMRQFLAGYVRLLEAMTRGTETRLGDIPFLDEDQIEALLALGRGESRAPCEEPPWRLFAAQAAARPAAIAVESLDGAARLSYGELDERSSQLAHFLLERGIGSEKIVVVASERSPELLVALLGIHKAGAAYLPVDPATPAERLQYLVEDSAAAAAFLGAKMSAKLAAAGLALATETFQLAPQALASLLAGRPSKAPTVPVALHSLAYVIYTSGSTGKPKGVLVEQAQLAHYSRDAAETYGITAADRVLQFASIGFDTSAEEIWPALAMGATLVLRDEEMIASPATFLRRLAAAEISLLNLPTAYWHELCGELGEESAVPACVRGVILGGEAALPHRLEQWLESLRAAGRTLPLWNTYGPTETTIVATRARLEDWTPESYGFEVPIGRPIAGMQALVLDAEGRLRPAGREGELYLSGAGVARGYLGRPALAAEKFRALPFTAGRAYATGDRVLLREDGTLLFRGRIDQQIKVRGYRVEPGEIEAALRRHEAVLDAVVEARPIAGELRLVAFLLGAPGGDKPGPAALRAYLAKDLPDYMVPATFLFLGAFPLTPAGKVDRRSLPTPDGSLLEEEGPGDLPRTPVEQLLAGIWCELLGLQNVSRDDDFFRLGGHSLLVGRMTSQLRKQLGVELPLVEVFENSRLAALAASLQKAMRRLEKADGVADELPAIELPPIEKVPRDGRHLPLSYPQERVWLLHQLEPNTIAYNFQATFWFEGKLDIPALENALSEIIRRHEIFYTRFPAIGGQPAMVIEKPWRVTLPVTDLSSLPINEANRRAEQILEEETRLPFDLTELPLIRWRLLRLAPDHHQLIQLEHHFVHDGWSLSVLTRELTILYRAFAAGKDSPLPELEVQYADFAYWQRQALQGPTLAGLLGWWRQNLEGMPQVLELPMDRPRPAQPSSRGESKNFLLPGKLYTALRQWSREQGFTLYMTMLAGFAALIYRYTGHTDFGLGGGVANRRQQAQQGLIGMIVNSVVLRCRLEGDPTFLELVRRMRRTSIEAYEHQDMPFERLVGELRPERHPSRNPLFQVMFSFHDAAMPLLDFGPELEVRGLVRTNRSAKLDLNVILAPQAEQRMGQAGQKNAPMAIFTWEYNRDLFDEATMKRMMRHYLDLLTTAIAQPEQRLSQLAMTSPHERAALLAVSSAPSHAPREASLAELWRAAAQGRPDAVAASADGAEITYGQLAQRSRMLATLLVERGVQPGELVGLALERGFDLLVGMLGILEAGAAYVPLDLSFPPERLRDMADDTAMRFAVAHAEQAAALPAALELIRPPADSEETTTGDGTTLPRVDGDFPAYVIYTSGSTGRPKGVVVPQRAVARLVLGANYVRIEPGEGVAQVASASFDAITFEVWAALLCGGRVVFIDRETLLAPEAFEAALLRGDVAAMFLTTAYFQRLAAERPRIFGRLKHLLFGGERCEPSLVRRAFADGEGRPLSGVLQHVYGPTECTTFATFERVAEVAEDALSLPIGKPISGTETYVLDRDFQLCPLGVAGELYLGGAGLALGYHRRPALTAEKFLPHPFSTENGARLYRTGDLVKRLPNGALDFLGRVDHQVKLRGFRIELGEVESALARLPAVEEAVVLLREDEPGHQRLVAYAVLHEGRAAEPAALRDALRQALPEFMVPAEVVVLDALPLGATGKIDRRALPAPERRQAETGSEAPETASEKQLAALFCELLGLDSVGVDESFFSLGGHSLLATQLSSRIAADLGKRLSLSQIFAAPTLRHLAQVLEDLPQATALEAPISSQTQPLAAAEGMSEGELDQLLEALQKE